MKLETPQLKVGVLSDGDGLLRLALNFAYSSPYKDLDIDEGKVRAILDECLSSPDKIVFYLATKGGPVGLLGATSCPNMFNDQKITVDLMYWIEPEYRNIKNAVALVKGYEYWSKKIIKAQITQLVCLDERVGKLYKHLGYDKAELTYLKVN